MIPLFVGVGTLALAVASVYVAHQSHESQRRFAQRAEDSEDKGERQRIGSLARQWVLAHTHERVGSKRLTISEAPPYLYLVLGDEVSASSQPHAAEFLREIRALVRQLPGESSREADTYAAELSASALFSTRMWVKDPLDWSIKKAIRVRDAEVELKPLRAEYETAKAGKAGRAGRAGRAGKN